MRERLGKDEEYKLDPSGGSILTRIIIFERPDLFEQCPDEIQGAIKLIHQGETLMSHSRFEEGRQFLQEAYKLLKSKSE